MRLGTNFSNDLIDRGSEFVADPDPKTTVYSEIESVEKNTGQTSKGGARGLA